VAAPVALPACFRLADDVFPRVRAEAARRLVRDGESQTRAAGLLGVSQAMVSKYVAAGRSEDDPLVLRLVEDLLADLGGSSPTGPSRWCSTLSIGQDRPGAAEALEDLLAAERLLREDPPLRLAPQVGLNIARALPDAAAPDAVLAYPGRMINVGTGIVAPLPPAFGASSHLARGLLDLRARGATALALANVRGGVDVARALRGLGRPCIESARDAPGDADGRLMQLTRRARGATLLHDPGAVGLEPCLYVAGSDARSVARAILDLEHALEEP